jgi:hypothetical protein
MYLATALRALVHLMASADMYVCPSDKLFHPKGGEMLLCILILKFLSKNTIPCKTKCPLNAHPLFVFCSHPKINTEKRFPPSKA